MHDDGSFKHLEFISEQECESPSAPSLSLYFKFVNKTSEIDVIQPRNVLEAIKNI